MVAPLGDALSLPVAYPVYCAHGVLNQLGSIVAQSAAAHRYAVISDETVAALHGARVVGLLPAGATGMFTVPPGEQHKSRAQWAALTDALLDWGAGRDTTVVALGGGVVGDLAGFVAATFMRGIPVVQVPTTLLAMVDAAIGGKTAVDTPFGKNLVGAFHHPHAVVMDPELLETLQPPLMRAGLAEMIKHGVVADASYFAAVMEALPQIGEPRSLALASLIAGSARIKTTIVAEDWREAGRRQVLNFGHTIGHAIEHALAYGISHGDAVAVGMLVEARIAELLGVAAAGLQAAIASAVSRAGLPTRLPAGVSIGALISATAGDKKVRSGMVRYSLPTEIGQMAEGGGTWSLEVDEKTVASALGDHLLS